MKNILFVCLSLFISVQAMAQIKISGIVLDDKDNSELIGANVVVKGTTNGTITDASGHFELSVPSSETVITVSSIGYQTQEIKVGKLTTFSIRMKEDAGLLDEVVVVGYGTSRKVDITGSVGSINGDKLKESIVTNADQMLQGRVAGVQVTQNSGAPGGASSIRIRGASSVTGDNEPLYIIDGIPMSGSGSDIGGFSWAGGSNGQSKVNPLASIAPSDIVSMDVLKDASACAIYGAAGANGVVIITTKRGQAGKINVTYDGYIGLQTFAKKIKMMNLQEYAQYQLDLYKEGSMSTINDAYRDPSLLGTGTDWQEEVTRDALMHSHQIGLSGGNDKTQYTLSGGYMNQDGTIIGSNFERFNSRANIDHEFAKWLKVGGSLAYSRTNEKIVNNDGINGVLLQSLVMQPDVPVYDFTGAYAGPNTVNGSSLYNPVALATRINNTLLRDRIMGGFYAQVNFCKELNFRSEYSFDGSNAVNKAFVPTYSFGVIENNINKIMQRNESSFYWLWKNYFNYNQTFNEKHHLGAMVGMEMSRSDWEGTTLQKQNLSSDDIQVIGVDGEYVSNTGWKDATSTMSVFGRFNYNYDDRYLATVTVRGDASSKFGANNRWGVFPSAALAWRINNEAFLRDVEEISNLKLRLGYGQVGNSNIGTYLYGSSMRAVLTPFGTAYRMNNFANPDLKWEASEQYNVGLDLGLFNSRVDLSVDVYRKSTKDLLLIPSVAAIIGGSLFEDIATPTANVGQVLNTGFDISLNTHNVKTKNFNWMSNIVVSHNKNMVVALDEQATPIYNAIDWYSEFKTASVIMVGQPMGVFYGFRTDGVFENEAAIVNGPVQVDDGTGNNRIDKNAGVWVGDIRFKDLNGDGFITDADQEVIGDPNPDFTFGFTNTFTYKNWELGVGLTGSVGGEILNYVRVKTEGLTSQWDNQASTVVNRVQYGYYDGDETNKAVSNLYVINADTDIPRWSTTDVNRNNRMSDRWLEDASYLRIQNLSLAYNFPREWLSRIHVSSLKLYVNAQNVYTFTKYSGYDPEIGAYNQQAGMQNIDRGRYPSPRVYTFGVNLAF